MLIAIGNSGDTRHVPQLEGLLEDTSPLVRAMAVWALAQLLSADAFTSLRAARLPGESEPDVRAEWG